MRTKTRWVLAALVLAAVGAAVGLLMLRTYALVADREPGRLETYMARHVVVLSIPSVTRKLANPNPPASDAWRDGEEHFDEHCAVCHGSDGRGRSEFAKKMYPPVPDLADPAIQAMSDGALFAVIQNGVRWTGMPAFRSEHTPEETWKLVSFVRRVPRRSAADLAPRPPHEGHQAGEGTGAPGQVAMDGTSFSPPTVTVAVGQTITWTNKDPFPHNVSSKDGGFRSGDLHPDRTWQWHAEKAGRFDYVCTLHPGMKGTVVVQAATQSTKERHE